MAVSSPDWRLRSLGFHIIQHRYATKYGVKDATRCPYPSPIYSNGPINPSVGFEGLSWPNKIRGFYEANDAGRGMVAAKDFTGLQSIAALAFATNKLSLGLALH
jgi:hypothetical protein